MLMNKFFHPFHLVTESPWPLLSSFSLLFFMLGVIMMFNNINMYMLLISSFMLILIIIQWWRDVIRESTLQGNHTYKVFKGIYMGMILFILSEIMFFVSFFWTYFHMFLSPSIEIGSNWPPMEILSFNPYGTPLLNTLILLSSGVSITWSHYEILNSMNYNKAVVSIFLTLILGWLFVFYQYKEYNECYFTISDCVYGSIFFMMTGFHGIHVIIGTIFILVSFIRLFNFHYSMFHHIGFEISAWYWHFVDVVWLFLYLFLYWFPN
uniref:Cytochrome c oxidase subunit 3 n=1 Tax=Phaenocarpa sp. QL-2014 TaxID=1491723 RepID=A0A0U1WEM9_9HYME|nr:cytochrome c oxidase subunit III [Phaenocarpa sp. QL-2014]